MPWPPVPDAAGLGALGGGCSADAAGSGREAAGVALALAGERAATGIPDGSGWTTAGADGAAKPGTVGRPVAPGVGAATAGFRPALAGPCRWGATAMTTAAAITV